MSIWTSEDFSFFLFSPAPKMIKKLISVGKKTPNQTKNKDS